MRCFARCVLLCLSLGLASCGRDNELYYVAYRGDTNAVQEYLDSGGDVNRSIRKFGSTVTTMLHVAVDRANVPLVEFLLARGADPNKLDRWQRTGLIAAVQQTHPYLVKLMLNFGADPNLPDGYGHGATPLYHAAMLTNPTLFDTWRVAETISALWAAGADMNTTTACGESPLFVVEDPIIAELLIAAGVDPMIRLPTGQSAVDVALAQSRCEVLTALTNALAKTNSHEP